MPASYTPKTRGSEEQEKTHSQTIETNMSAAKATVGDVLSGQDRELYSIAPEATVGQAVEILRDKRIGALAVVSEGDLVGILSERDIVRRLADTPGQTLPQTVSGLMSTKVVTCTAEENLVSVLRRMTDGRFRHMPVVEDGRPINMITIGDVVNYRLTALEYEALKLKQLIVG